MTAVERCARCGRDVDINSEAFFAGDVFDVDYLDGVATSSEFVCASCVPIVLHADDWDDCFYVD